VKRSSARDAAIELGQIANLTLDGNEEARMTSTLVSNAAPSTMKAWRVHEFVVAVTAWQGLFDHARLEAGQTVVIHGAAGNVGAYAVQLARRARLRSIATAGTKDIDYVRALGADKVVDYQTQRFEDEVRNADAVLDLVGGDTQIRSLQVLRRGGKLISTVSKPNQDRAKQHGVTAAFFLVEVTTERLGRIAELIDRGELKVRVGAVLPFADARDAHMMLEGRRPQPQGKIILLVEPGGDVT
jgi:NADPH:quinone reductase-like Zn-dependent oxidoreductase